MNLKTNLLEEFRKYHKETKQILTDMYKKTCIYSDYTYNFTSIQI